jgi:uncharacterized membrane protein HdeD (DUF308 family)
MAFWITLGRSLFAIALGVAILFNPDKARPLLGNFIGGFWLAGSLISLRWGLAQDRSKLLTILVALVGALAGLAMVGRTMAERWVPTGSLTILLGIVALLTGVLHVTGNLQVKRFTDRSRTDSGTILGGFEIFLGAILLLTPYTPSEERPFLNLIAVGWALVGGIVIFFDALAMRREAKKVEQNS